MSKTALLLLKAALLLCLAGIAGLFGYIALRQTSPGRLSRSHDNVTNYAIIRNCRKCHSRAGLADGCLGCHKEIAAQLQTKRGYHNTQMAKHLESVPRAARTLKQTGCAVCHTEHNGLEFDLMGERAWQGRIPLKFEHDKIFPFTLAGKHDELKCEQCHNTKYRRVITLPDYPKIARRISFLGLTQDCLQCHEDKHQSPAATRCLDCHVQTKWKPAPKFNHDKFFPIRGGHVLAACQKCHITAPTATQRINHIFNLVKGKKCADCHKNPHRPLWPNDCESCHKSEDAKWAESTRRVTAAAHERSGFQLIAPHQKTACDKCHEADLPFAKKYRDPQAPGYNRWPKRCEGCHKDIHKGQFLPKHTQCMDCHTQKGFKPSSFTVKEHTSYSLVGKHLTAACTACHAEDKLLGARRFTKLTQRCNQCHRDAHWQQFRIEGETRCEECHFTALGWNKLVFNHETQSKFKLDSAHIKVKCSQCHPKVVLPNKAVIVQYKPLWTNCGNCHDYDTQ